MNCKKLSSLVLVIVLCLSLLPFASLVTPARAAVSWASSSSGVTLENEPYVLDSWVIKDGGTYKMWYTHLSSSLSLGDLLSDFGDLGLDQVLDDLASLNIDVMLNDLSNIAETQSAALWDFLTGNSVVIGYATSNNGTTWSIQDDNVLAGSNGIFDSVGFPCVILDGSTYKMWYTRVVSDLTEVSLTNILDALDGVAATRKTNLTDLLNSFYTVIGYATSNDGTTWTVVDNEMNALSGDTLLTSVGDPSVIKDGSTYRMWYTRGQTDLTGTDLQNILDSIGTFDIDTLASLMSGTGTVISYATSSDGTAWTIQDADVLENGLEMWNSIASPSVILNGSTYEMWYSNIQTASVRADLQDALDEFVGFDIPGLWNTLDTLGLDAFLDDLLNLDTAALETVLSDSTVRIGYATSTNLTTWTVEDETDIAALSAGAWSSVADPCVVKDGGEYYAWYLQGIQTFDMQGLVDIVTGADLPIGFSTTVTGGGGGGGIQPPPTGEDLVNMDPADAAAVVENLPADEAATLLAEVASEDAAAIIEELSTDVAASIITEMDAGAAADIISEVVVGEAAAIVEELSVSTAASVVEEMTASSAADIFEELTTGTAVAIVEAITTGTAADILEEMTTATAATILEEVESVTASAIMQQLSTAKLTDVILEMNEEALTERLPGLTPEKIFSIEPELLFQALPNAPTEQLVSEEPPQPPAESDKPVVVYTTPSGGRYLAVRTWQGEWVIVAATPPPISQVMIKTKSELTDVETTLEVFDSRPADVPALPEGQVARAYFTVDFANIAEADIEVGYLSFYVEKSWVDANSINLWAVFLNFYDPELKAWVALPTKKVNEDSSKVYYTAAVPHFSTFAITGSQDVPAQGYSVSNLSIVPSEPKAGEAFKISADVANRAGASGNYVIELWLDSTIEQAQTVSLAAGETRAISFNLVKNAIGSYEVRIDRVFGSFTVVQAPPPKPAAFSVASLSITPAEVKPGDTVTISVAVTNTGEVSGTYTVTLKLNGAVAETKNVTLDGGATKTVAFTTTQTEDGIYTVDVNGMAGAFSVKSPPVPPKPIRWPLIVAVIAGVLVIGAAIFWFVRRRE